MLASLAVDLADHYKKTHGRGDEILKALEARRTDVEVKLANFVKAISQGIFNASTVMSLDMGDGSVSGHGWHFGGFWG